jgi:hypothetical protein
MQSKVYVRNAASISIFGAESKCQSHAIFNIKQNSSKGTYFFLMINLLLLETESRQSKAFLYLFIFWIFYDDLH